MTPSDFTQALTAVNDRIRSLLTGACRCSHSPR